jgi:PAS domain S-box-containing protein
MDASLRLALERSTTAVCGFDLEGRYTFVNDAAVSVIGVPRDELLGQSYLAPGRAPEGGPFDLAFRATVADGVSRRVRVLNSGGNYEIDVSRAADLVLVLWRDVAELVELHREVHLERDRWRVLFEQAPAQVGVLTGPEHRYVFMNQLAREAIGGRTDVVGKTAREAFPELAGSPLFDIVDEVYRSGRPWIGTEIPVAFAGPDGRPVERFFTFVYQPFTGADGDVAGIMTFGFDVTETVRARRRVERMFDANLIGNMTWHIDGPITRANDALLRMLGYTAEEFTPQVASWRDLTPPEFAHLDVEAVEQLRTTRIHAPFEKAYRHKDGSHVPVLVSSAFFPDSDVEGISYVVDLTDVKAAEARVRDLLREANAAAKAKDEFLAMLGHELRNPLAPITSAVEVLRLRHGDIPELGTLGRQVRHMSRLVDDLLDVAKIARGEIPMERVPLDLRRAIDRGVEMARPLIQENTHELTLRGPEGPLTVVGDEARLAQAISNLLVNAARYTPPGGRIELTTQLVTSEATPTARVQVRDNGRGIAPELLPHVFDLFVSNRSEPHQQSGGLGLGLAIVQNVVRLHGGEVSATSAGPNLGSEFVISLPAVEEPSAAAHVNSPRTQTSGGAGRVLVVDDNEDAALLLSMLLEQRGYPVRTASSGREAIASLEHFVPEVAILDLGMPDMSGFEVARALRERLGRNVRLLALTGYGQDRDREATRAAGFDAHLVKPVALDVLLEVLESPLARPPRQPS